MRTGWQSVDFPCQTLSKEERSHGSESLVSFLIPYSPPTDLLGLKVQLEDLIPTLSVRLGHPDFAVKAPGTHKCRIQQVRPGVGQTQHNLSQMQVNSWSNAGQLPVKRNVSPVGRAEEYYACVGRETIHLGEQLVERLLPLLIHFA